MNEIKKQALIKEIQILENKVEETRMQKPNDVPYYEKVALNTFKYYLDNLLIDVMYDEYKERFKFKFIGSDNKYCTIEEFIPLCIEYLRCLSEQKLKLCKVPLKLHIYKIENYDLREQMIVDIYNESKDKNMYYDEFTKLNQDYILLNSKFDINSLIQKNECVCAYDKITFENISLKILLTSIQGQNPKVRKISVGYKTEYKQLDIHEATKYIDECIADYNNSIE